jgi:hypothetical protein
MTTALTAASLVSTEVVSKTISYTASSIYSIGKTIFYTDPSVDLSSLERLEKKLDLIATIQIYELWIQEVTPSSSVALHHAILSFKKGLEELHAILQRIEEKIKFHKQKWFYGYRTISFIVEMEDIQLYKSILDQRFALIQQINK